MKSTKGLRFAPVIRVSTESQENRGASIRVQREQILRAVEIREGYVPNELLEKYSGQEHATAGRERKKLDLLLKDSGESFFDAVMVDDASRWTRNNSRSEEALDILLENGIRFFVGLDEYDLADPNARMILGVNAVISQYETRKRLSRSLMSRASRLKNQKLPSNGKKPFGRKFIWSKDRQSGHWKRDPEKWSLVIRAARHYLSTGRLSDFAERERVNYSNLLRNLKYRCGNEWTVKYINKQLGVHVTETLKVPRLLPETVIQAIHERKEKNKTYYKGDEKNRYPLTDYVYCSKCKRKMSGQTNSRKKRYYRHPHRDEHRNCVKHKWVPAEDLEKAILIHLFSMYGDPKLLEDAIKSGATRTKEIKTLRRKLKDFETSHINAMREKNRVLDFIAKGIVTENEAKTKLDAIREREAVIHSELNAISAQLKNTLTDGELKSMVNAITDEMHGRGSSRQKVRMNAMKMKARLYKRIPEMGFEEKRALFEKVFSGKDIKGTPYGVYVIKLDGKWEYQIRGELVEGDAGKLPMSAWKARMLLDLPDHLDGSDYDPWIGEGEPKTGSTESALRSPTPALP